jgi:thiamine transport system substrate-binding protein
VVSYATSPAAELFYSKEKLTQPPTGSLSLPGAVFKQVEGVALVKGGQARPAAEKFIEFMRSAEVQKQIQTEMWMYPVEPGVALADAMKFAPEPAKADTPSEKDIADKGAAWVARWTQVVLK